MEVQKFIWYPCRNPFNLSNIIVGNVSNQSFSFAKNGAGNLAIILTHSLSIRGKKEVMKLSNNWHCEKNRTDDSGALSLKNDESCTRTTNLEDFITPQKESVGKFFVKVFF